MRVAVIIAARDIASFLPDAIRSALGQSHAGKEVVVVDDGSVDETPDVLRALCSPRLFSLTTPGLGVAAARNRGACHPAARSADALLFLDGDDWLAATALTTLTEALDRAPDAVAAHMPFAFVAETARPDTPGLLDCRRAPGRSDLLRPLVRGNLFANGGHVLIRAGAWQAAGPFREDLAFAEDWEFWTRLALQGRFCATGNAPGLFVRRRAGSLMHGAAARPESYRPALAAIAANPHLRQALGPRPLARLCRQAARELCWTIGRERLRRGAARAALPLLLRGLPGRWRPQRLAVLAHAAWSACRPQRG